MDATQRRTALIGPDYLSHSALKCLVLALMALGAAAAADSNLVQLKSSMVDDSTCECRILTGWSEMAEYQTVQDMMIRLVEAEELVETMNFTLILEQLQNLTDRLNTLEEEINTQTIAASVTELFALRKKVELLVNVMEANNDSSLMHHRRDYLVGELSAIANVTNAIWARNPYKQKQDYQKEVATLRSRFSRCQTDVSELSPFAGDSLPLNVSMFHGWCPAEGDLTIGFPLTHRWEDETDAHRGMWFKDPKPADVNSTTEVWEVVYKSTTRTQRSHYQYHSYDTVTVITTNLRKFSKYSSLLVSDDVNNPAEVVANPDISGYGAVVYGNVLYYNHEKNLIRLDLVTKVKTTVPMGFQSVGYSGPASDTHLDLKVDETGLWLVYSVSSDGKLAISRLDPNTLLIQKTWITEIQKASICSTFMVCGRLYTVRSCSTRLQSLNDNKNYVYDTATSRGYYRRYHVPSLYGSLTQLTYNPRERMLFGWDKAHLVTYAIGWAGEM